MQPRLLMWVGCAALAVMLNASCSSCEGEEVDGEPLAQLESGFSFGDDAFTFSNFGGQSLGPHLTPDLMVRMFGQEGVCLPDSSPCELTPVAQMWMEGTNETLEQGRSEGFAVLSLMFFAGHLDPADFGADTVSQLRLSGNRALQKELAYWAATQSVPASVTEDERYDAAGVLPFLERALDPDSDTHYRLAIAQRTEDGFHRGHALTPIGYYKGEGDTYWLRVYDNNFPQRVQRLAIDPVANTWRYEVLGVDGEHIVYEGNADNGNLLYFSPIESRLGVLQAPFNSDSGALTLTYSGVTVVSTNAQGEATGIRDGVVIEAPGEKVVPAFAQCPLCGTPVSIVNQTMIAAGMGSRIHKISSTKGVSRRRLGVDGDEQSRGVQGGGPDFITKVTPKGSDFQDEARFGEDGEVTYTSSSGAGIDVTHSGRRPGGGFDTTTVKIEGSEDEEDAGSFTVNVKPDEDGKVSVEIEGLPEGKRVTIEKEFPGGKKETVTYVSTGESSSVTFDPNDGEVESTGVKDVELGHCLNGGFDEDKEFGVDCGLDCASGCADGTTCMTADDCLGGTCDASGVCLTATCSDGMQGEDETDVDCGGGTCPVCVATASMDTPRCELSSDCDSQLCVDDQCRKKLPVYLRIDRVPSTPNGLSVNLELDGVWESIHIQADLAGEEDLLVYAGEAYAYRYYSNGICYADNVTQYTGITSADDTETDGLLELNCPPDGFATLELSFNDLYHAPDSSPVVISPSDPVKLGVKLDGGSEQVLEYSGNRNMSLGDYQNHWSVRILSSPTDDSYPSPHEETSGQTGGIMCELLGPWSWGSTSSGSSSSLMQMSCRWGTYSCDDGLHNQDEAAVDCGGSCASKCALGASCFVGSDCESTMCVEGTCVSQCVNGIKDGDETDVDCGGSCPTTCAQDAACLVDGDCSSGLECRDDTCQTPLGPCANGLQDGNETDVDCGGSCPTTCAQDAACLVDGDCDSGLECRNNTCQTPLGPCANGLKDGDETDVDCGGSCSTKCAVTQACTLDADCASNDCECGTASGMCTSASGTCGAAQYFLDQPVASDEVSASGTFTVPSGCTSIFVQAWGAAGGAFYSMGFAGTPGGAGGYVDGTLTVAPGDVITVWLGQGGGSGSTDGGKGSLTGTPASGGLGGGDAFSGQGGDGGGLTSLQITGSTSLSFSVPGGGGGGEFAQGGAATVTGGGGAAGYGGESALFDPYGGGGAGENGGTVGIAGAYGTLPTGLSAYDGTDPTPSNTSNADYSRCQGVNAIPAGSGDDLTGIGGDSCVILRCVGQ